MICAASSVLFFLPTEHRPEALGIPLLVDTLLEALREYEMLSDESDANAMAVWNSANVLSNIVGEEMRRDEAVAQALTVLN